MKKSLKTWSELFLENWAFLAKWSIIDFLYSALKVKSCLLQWYELTDKPDGHG